MSMKQRILAAVGGIGLTLAVAVTAVMAGGPLGSSAAPTTAATPTAGASATPRAAVAHGRFDGAGFGAFGLGDPAQCQDVQNKLATNLGVTTAQLQAAIKKTLVQEIDEAQAAGKLTADQAQAARDRVNNATDLCSGFGVHTGGPGGRWPGGDQGAIGGARFGDGATYQAVATHFGITIDQLRQDIQEKGSLQGVAAKYGKDTTAGKAALQTALEGALKDDLAKHGLAQEMIDRVVAEFRANFDSLYTANLGQKLPFGPGGPGKHGGPRTSPRPSATPQTQ